MKPQCIEIEFKTYDERPTAYVVYAADHDMEGKRCLFSECAATFAGP